MIPWNYYTQHQHCTCGILMHTRQPLTRKEIESLMKTLKLTQISQVKEFKGLILKIVDETIEQFLDDLILYKII